MEENLMKTLGDIGTALGEIRRSIIVMMKDVWTCEELALVMNVSESRVRHMAAEKVIPSYRPTGGKLYFKRSEIEAWMTSHRATNERSEAATREALRRLKRQ